MALNTKDDDKKKKTTKAKSTDKKITKKASTNATKSTKKTTTKKASKTTSVKASSKKSTTESKKERIKETIAPIMSDADVSALFQMIDDLDKAKKRVNTKKVKSKNIIENINVNKDKPIVVEYYDLPFKYNKTVVKFLAQNPNTLFVYWEISDDDRNELEKQFGKNFFEITKPVLLITNITNNYTYEVDINDFANNWYIHVNDAKCKYQVELGRRLIEQSDDISQEYVPITQSNIIESPNDHVLFFKDGDVLHFKNIKTNDITEKIYHSKDFAKDVESIYKDYELENDGFNLNNPSSGNPSSDSIR